jgi:sporulation protein YlmC with PRC-barrel domain
VPWAFVLGPGLEEASSGAAYHGNQEGVAQMMTFRIGADAMCTDGARGQVSRIIVNQVTREVTHLAVDPRHQRGPGRLVPVDLVDATAGQIRLRCTLAEFQALRPARETESVRDLDPTGHGHQDSTAGKVSWADVGGAVIMQRRGRGEPQAPPQVTVNYLPDGAVDVRRELTVSATDGEIGQVQGLIMDPGGHQVTHVLLQKGHMRGRKEVAIPIGAVTKIGTMLIHLSLTKHQVKDLPPVDIDHLTG